MVDLHWKFTATEALALIAALAPYRPHFVEAPVKPEDHAGLARVARESPVPIAAGEEWYTAYEVRNRLDAGPIAVLQPEMGHTGITQFRRIAALAAEQGDRDRSARDHRHRIISCGEPAGLGNIAAPVEA